MKIYEYLALLRSLAEPCDYGAVLDEMLRDRLIIGINDDAIQRRLLSEPDLDLARAIKLATSMESADKNVL